MKLEEIATKKDLAELEARLGARIDKKMDIKLQYFAKKILDDISEILVDLTDHIDRRFTRIEDFIGIDSSQPPKNYRNQSSA